MFSQILYAAVAPYHGEQAGQDLEEQVGSTCLFNLASLAGSIGAFRRSSGFLHAWRVGRVKARGIVVTSAAICKRSLVEAAEASPPSPAAPLMCLGHYDPAKLSAILTCVAAGPGTQALH